MQGKYSILAIDLGVTTATMALLDDDGKTRVVPNAEGSDMTPTAVHIFGEDDLVVGREALSMQELDPDHVVENVPLHLGEDNWFIEAFSRKWTAQELTAHILRKLVKDAEALRGEPFEHIMICLPAWYDSARRNAVLDAAKIAGIHVESMVNQPIVAALGAGLQQLSQDGLILLIDIGGRDTELSIISRTGGSLALQTNAVRFDSCYAAFEARVRRWLMDTTRATINSPLPEDARLAQQIRDAARNLLATLSTRSSAATRLASGPIVVKAELQRPLLAKITAELLTYLDTFINDLLAAQHIMQDDLIAVVVVGKGARLPLIHDRLNARFRDRLLPLTDATHAMALGTALLAALRHQPEHPGLHVTQPQRTPAKRNAPRRRSTPDYPGSRAVIGLADGGSAALMASAIQDTTSQSLGLIALDKNRKERVVQIIRDGSVLPCEARGRFSYAFPGMVAIRVEITEGRGTRRDHVRVIGIVELHGLPPRPVGTPIDIIYAYGVDQVLRVDVIDVDSGIRRRVDLTFRGGMSDDEIKRATHRADAIHVQ